MTRILVSGVAVLDFIFHMDAFPNRPDKYRAKGADIVGGGNAANSAVAIARLGGTAQLASRLGDDEVAELILTGLKAENIDCSLVRKFSGKKSSFSSIYIDATGERQIMNFRDNNLSMNADWLSSQLPETFSAAMADTRWPDGAAIAMQAAKERNVPGIIDAEAPVNESARALPLASHVAFSAQGVADFTGESDVEKAALRAAKDLPGRVLVTDGARGVVVVRDGKPHWHPAIPITPVDTLGAGDVWHGAFALALGEGMDEDRAIGFASACASLKCTRTGGRDGAPTRAEVNRFLEEHE